MDKPKETSQDSSKQAVEILLKENKITEKDNFSSEFIGPNLKQNLNIGMI